jgi:FkbM family methyltransferase
MELEGFDWGWMNEGEGLFHKNSITQEIFVDNIYEKLFQVKEGDTVVDVGASVGPFTFSILPKNPKRVFCIEPSDKEFITLSKNLPNSNVTLINKGISSTNSLVESTQLFGGETQMDGITFETFLKENNIEVIDFMKTDCEGGEYDILLLIIFAF